MAGQVFIPAAWIYSPLILESFATTGGTEQPAGSSASQLTDDGGYEHAALWRDMVLLWNNCNRVNFAVAMEASRETGTGEV